MVYKKLQRNFPQLEKAKFAESWTHRRVGSEVFHQLHFDSENEGRTDNGILNNPLLTVVLFLECDEERHAPTLISEQTPEIMGDGPSYDSAGGYVVLPTENSCCCFEGNLLHGVLPAQFDSSSFQSESDSRGKHMKMRHTLMVSFWESLQQFHNGKKKNDKLVGIELKRDGKEAEAWAGPIFSADEQAKISVSRDAGENSPALLRAERLLRLDRVWERLPGSNEGDHVTYAEAWQY